MIVISDTSPLNYLILIGAEGVLTQIFGQVYVTPAVLMEMKRSKAPDAVRLWAETPPPWITVRAPAQLINTLRPRLHEGEIHTISLAEEFRIVEKLRVDWVIIDDWDARMQAKAMGIPLLGTFNILEEAAVRELLDIDESSQKLRNTNYRATPDQYEAAIQNVRRRKLAQKTK